MRRILCLFLFISTSLKIVAAPALEERINATLQQAFPQATVAILVKNATTGAVLFQKNAQQRLMPGSSVKLYTAAAAFYHFKANERFQTKLLKNANTYYIKFSGAPDFSSSQLKTLLEGINHSGPIKGNIVLDTSRFQAPYYPGGISYDDLGWYYAAPDTAAIMDGNEASFKITMSKEIGGSVAVQEVKAHQGLDMLDDVKTVSVDYYRKHCSFNIERLPENQSRLYGCLPQRAQPRIMKFAITDPVYRAKTWIKNNLKIKNIRMKGTLLEGKTPAKAQVLASVDSSPLSDMVQHMLQESDNLYANSITKQLAYAVTGAGSYKQGIFAMKKILSEQAGLKVDDLKLADGMGTRYNLMSAHQLVDLLTVVYKNNRIRKLFIRSLAQSGVSGTLAFRMKQPALKNRIYAKTGTMHDLSSLSGFYLRENKDPLIFSIIINNVNAPIIRAKAVEEKILEMIQDL